MIQPLNINSKEKHSPCSLGLSTWSVVLLLPFTVTPMDGAIQGVLALESSVAEGPTLQLELLLSMSLEEKDVRELECLHRTDSRSGFSGGLSTMVIIHFLWKNRRVCQLNHFWQHRQTDFSFTSEVVLKGKGSGKASLSVNCNRYLRGKQNFHDVALLLRSEMSIVQTASDFPFL